MANKRLVEKNEPEETALRLAVLIDADNAQAAVIEGLLAEISRFGEATVKRIYGDFTAPTSASWKKVLQRYAIKPVKQQGQVWILDRCKFFIILWVLLWSFFSFSIL